MERPTYRAQAGTDRMDTRTNWVDGQAADWINGLDLPNGCDLSRMALTAADSRQTHIRCPDSRM
jgi:hypothetical protein